MSLASSLLSITARGGLKTGFILLTISLFTGLVVAVQSMSYSYASEAAILKEISRNPNLLVSYETKGQDALKVQLASVNVNGYTIIIVASKDLEQYVILQKVKMEGEYPRNGEILAGEKLKPLLQNGMLLVEGQLLNVSGFVSAPVYLSSAILLTSETMEILGIDTIILYYEEATESSETDLGEAPSSASLVQAVTKEVLNSLTLVTILLHAMLALTCITQGYNAAHESKVILEVFSALGTSGKKMAASLCVLALAITSGGMVLGYAFGIMTSAFASSLMSLTLGLPYIKPIASLHLICWLGSAFTISFITVTGGLVKGYFSVDSC
jgi:hypothetical protein